MECTRGYFSYSGTYALGNITECIEESSIALSLSQVLPSVIAVIGFISFNTTTNYIDTIVKKLANRINDIKISN
jgi:hypothetical protein